MVFGREADKNELTKTTPDKPNVVDVDKDDNPTDIGREIIEKALAGWYVLGSWGLLYESCSLHRFCLNLVFLDKDSSPAFPLILTHPLSAYISI